MGHVVGIKFRDQGQVIYHDARPYVVTTGDLVLVKTEEGLRLGHVVDQRSTPPGGQAKDTLHPVFRLATSEDRREHEENIRLARKAFDHCRDCIASHGLEMKLVDVEVYFDRSKMIFYFTAPGRIDFRELVKDLVRAYRTRIELRQIGVRHETQMLGAVGNCGRVCCCRQFLRSFEPVTIKMAKDQNLFLNPAKISGVCGRLLCCLAYEKDTYTDFQKRVPKMGKKFTTSLGSVKTLRSNMFRDSVIVLTEDRQEREVSLDEWHEILSSKPQGRPTSPPGKPLYEARRPVSKDKGGQDDTSPSGSKSSKSREWTNKPQRKSHKAPRANGSSDEGIQPRRPGHQPSRHQDKEGHAESFRKGSGKKRKPSRKRSPRKKPSQKKSGSSS